MAPYETRKSWRRPDRSQRFVVPLDYVREQTTSTGKKIRASKLTSRFVGQAYRLPFFLAAAASVLFAVQLRSGCAENAREQVTLDTETHPVQNSVEGRQVVNVKEYGAVGDGVTNDTAVFNKALAVCAVGGGTCLVPKGTYLISASGVTSHVKSGVHLVGEGRGVSILKIAAMPTGALIWGDGDNWSVENLTIDMQDYFPPQKYSAIACRGNNWRVANCSIVKMGRIGIGVAGGDNWSIEDNYISKTTPVQTLNQSILVTKDHGKVATNARIIDNVCDGSGILFWGFYSTITGNRISNAGFGSGIATGQVANCHTVQVIGNTCSGGRGFDENQTWVSGFELWGSDSVIANNTAYDNASSGIIVGGQNCVVKGNHSYNNGVQDRGYGFSARYQNSTINASHSIFIRNSAYDTRYPGRGMTQTYGYREQPGGLKDIKQIGNTYNHNKIGSTSNK